MKIQVMRQEVDLGDMDIGEGGASPFIYPEEGIDGHYNTRGISGVVFEASGGPSGGIVLPHPSDVAPAGKAAEKVKRA